jgi:hypothetical protein
MQDKNKLRRGVSISIRTAMVGAIAAFEEEFGELWGQNKQHNERTPEEKAMFQKWQGVRTEIFDKGNRCLNIAIGHLNKFFIN